MCHTGQPKRAPKARVWDNVSKDKAELDITPSELIMTLERGQEPIMIKIND